MTHWKALTDCEYIGAYAFQPGQEITATIKTVRRELVTGADGKKENCTVVYFSENGTKPLILNATNAKMITKVAGTPYIEEWSGKAIVMGVEKVKAFGDVVEAVRVRNKRPAPTRPAPVQRCADCGEVIQPFGQMTAEQVAKYTLGKFGVMLCVPCGQARADAAGSKAEASEQKQDSSEQSDSGGGESNSQ